MVQGWECPKCSAVWAPTTAGCLNCKPVAVAPKIPDMLEKLRGGCPPPAELKACPDCGCVGLHFCVGKSGGLGGRYGLPLMPLGGKSQ